MVLFLIFESERKKWLLRIFFTLLLPINKWSCILHLDFECLVDSFLVENDFLISQLIHACVPHLNLLEK